MQWLNSIVDEIIAHFPSGEILIESGSSPSGTYHLGHLRELITSDAIRLELKHRGRQARHVAFIDDLDALRKIPINVPSEYEKYLGRSLCDIPSPNDPTKSYADYFLQGLILPSKTLGIDVEFILAHDKYRSGFFIQAIEKALKNASTVRGILENISGHKLGDEWSPVQINEDGYLKKRRFVSIDTVAKTIAYKDKDGQQRTIGYTRGEVKLDWRIDWPARWWLLNVNVEPFGRDHATKGGSFDTGAAMVRDVFAAKPPLPVPYDFVNMTGDTKKMSASKGTGLDAEGVVKVLPPEIVRYFMLRSAPSKRLYFDPVNGVSQLIDEFAELLSKKEKSKEEEQLIEICCAELNLTISRVPFSHLVASYQAALKDPEKTIDIIKRAADKGYGIEQDTQVLIDELKYIDQWLKNWAPEDVKFELAKTVDAGKFTDAQKQFLYQLADKIERAPENADGAWFHKAIYDFKDNTGMEPKDLFQTLYRALIGKDSGPRAGWFLSTLPRDWLIKRLRLEY